MSPRALTPQRSLILLALVLTAIRLVFAGLIPLTEDEAYYRLWAQHLQFGYYDHPPMVAWWIRLGQLLAGDTAFGIRLIPTLGTGLATWLIGDLAQRLGLKPATAFTAALWYNATLTVGLGGMLAIPDVPASLFWVTTLWCLTLAWRSGGGAWWLAAGAAAGLAALSKYSALFLAPGVFLWLILTVRGRQTLLTPGPWLAAGVACLLFMTNVVWNANHDWITFTKQFGRVAATTWSAEHFGEFLLTQFALLNPLIALFALAGIVIGVRRRREADGPDLLLPIATSLPFFVYLLVHSLHDRVQGHWPVPLFGALAICAAVASEGAARNLALRVGRWAAPILGYGLSAFALVLMAAPRPLLLIPDDPTGILRGWPELAGAIEGLRNRHGAAWVGTLSYGTAAQLEATQVMTAPVLHLMERDRYWLDGTRAPDVSRPGVVVDLSRRMSVDLMRLCFREVAVASDLERSRHAGHNGRYTAYVVSGPKVDVWRKGCPEG